MDKITLIDKNMEFMTRFAAPSVLTGRFVAAVLDSNKRTIKKAFTNPGRILVHNIENLYADNIYEGYTRINEIRDDGKEITVVLDRGETNE